MSLEGEEDAEIAEAAGEVDMGKDCKRVKGGDVPDRRDVSKNN